MRMPMTRLLYYAAPAIVFATALHAQSTSNLVAFEVASVKSAAKSSPTRITPSSFEITLPLASLIAFAYRLPTMQVVDEESWVRTEVFEVRATLPDADARITATQRQEQISRMLQTLLAERFALRVRDEERVLPRYVLRVKDPKRTTAPGRFAAAPRCTAQYEAAKARPASSPLPAAPTAASPPLPPSDNKPSRCGFLYKNSNGNLVTWESAGASVEEFLSNVQMVLGAPVVNQTDIGDYIALRMTIAGGQDPQRALSPTNPQSLEGPSLATALARELNIDLKSEKGPVRVIAVQHAERPKPN